MKKTVVVLLVLALCVTSLFAGTDLNIGLGVLSSVGVSTDMGSFEFGADVRSTFPVTALAGGLIVNANKDKIENVTNLITEKGEMIEAFLCTSASDITNIIKKNTTFGKAFGLTAKFYLGADAYALYNIVNNGINTFGIGPSITAGRLTLDSTSLTTITAVSADLKFKHMFNEKHGLFIQASVPLVTWVKGFDTITIKDYINDFAKGFGVLAYVLPVALYTRIGYTYSF